MRPRISLFQHEVKPVSDESGRMRFKIVTNGEEFAIQRLWTDGWKWIETLVFSGYRVVRFKSKVVRFKSKKEALAYLKKEWGAHFVVEPNEWHPI